MRRTLMIAVALMTIVPGFCVPALAQSPDAKSTDLKIELKKKRSVVRPPADTGPATGEAEAAAQRMEEERRAGELQRKAMPSPAPPLDESVVEGSRARQLRESPTR